MESDVWDAIDQYHAGDLVRLKSGGPVMTVQHARRSGFILSSEGRRSFSLWRMFETPSPMRSMALPAGVFCLWFVGGEQRSDWFMPWVLEPMRTPSKDGEYLATSPYPDPNVWGPAELAPFAFKEGECS